MSKKVNPWVEHVKKYAKENNLSYMCAVEQARKSYIKPIKIGKRQKLKEKEEQRLEEYKKSGDEYALNQLATKMAKRDKLKEQREARKNPQTKFSLSQLQEKMDSLIDKSKTAKGDELVFINDLIIDIRNAISEKESQNRKIDFSKKSLEELNDELKKLNEFLNEPENDETRDALKIRIKQIESVIKNKKKMIKDKQKKQMEKEKEK